MNLLALQEITKVFGGLIAVNDLSFAGIHVDITSYLQ